jgi:hypothetical protein
MSLVNVSVQINRSSPFDSYGFSDSRNKQILRFDLLHQSKNGTNVKLFSDSRTPSTTPTYIGVELSADKKSYVCTLYGNNGVVLELIQYESKKTKNFYKVIKDRRDDTAIRENNNVFNDVPLQLDPIGRPEVNGEVNQEEESNQDVLSVLGQISSLNPNSALEAGLESYHVAEESSILGPIIDDISEYVLDEGKNLIDQSLEVVLSLEEPFDNVLSSIDDATKEIVKITEEGYKLTKKLFEGGFDIIKWIFDHGWLFLGLFVLILILAILIGLKNLL